jgi:hypothetical protein
VGLLAVSFGDGGGEIAFTVVAVSVVDGPPVVDHDHALRIGRDVALVLGVTAELVEVLDEPAQVSAR